MDAIPTKQELQKLEDFIRDASEDLREMTLLLLMSIKGMIDLDRVMERCRKK